MYRLDLLDGMNLHSIECNYLIKSLNDDINRNVLHQHISITNTEAMYFGSKNLNHFNYINNAKFSLCDGIGLKIAGKFHNLKIKRYHGPDVMMDIINFGQKFEWTHYILGGKENVASHLEKVLLNKFPNARILKIYSPPFRELTNDEKIEMLSSINKLSPNFLWVGLGLPKQEKWIMNYKNHLNVNFCIGVGAAFDFHSNNIKRAPIIFQKLGLEWLYRVVREPRMLSRNLTSFKYMFKLFCKGATRTFK